MVKVPGALMFSCLCIIKVIIIANVLPPERQIWLIESAEWCAVIAPQRLTGLTLVAPYVYLSGFSFSYRHNDIPYFSLAWFGLYIISQFWMSCHYGACSIDGAALVPALYHHWYLCQSLVFYHFLIVIFYCVKWVILSKAAKYLLFGC